MKVWVCIVSVLLTLAACKSNSTVKNSTGTELEESSSLPVELDEPTTEGAAADFVDEYAQQEYFDINRYIVDEETVPADSIVYIKETCYIQTWRIDIREFEDEESEEAQDYYTAADDLSYYMYEASSMLESLGVPDTVTYKRFIKLDVENGRSIVVDTEKYEQKLWMLLYKKGRSPLVIDIVDSNENRAKSYLGINS